MEYEGWANKDKMQNWQRWHFHYLQEDIESKHKKLQNLLQKTEYHHNKSLWYWNWIILG